MSSTNPRLVVAVLCAVQFVDVLGVTSALTAIPAILAGVHAPAEATGLLATSYAMFFGGLLVLGSRLGDRYGARRVLLVGIAVFAVVALVGATATGIAQVLIARALQGAAAAVSVPCALRLLLHAGRDPALRRTALAWWSASGAVAGVLGYLVGGFLTAALSWRAVFWVNAPIAVLLLLGVLAVPRLPPQDRRARLDLVGAALLIGAVMAVIVGCSLVEAPELRLVGGLVVVAGLGLAGVFVLQQHRAAEPLIPRAAAASRPLRIGSAVSFVNTATTSSTGVLATLLLQQQLGLSALQAGLVLVPLSAGVVAGSLLTRVIGGRVVVPARMAAVGLAGIAAGNLVLTVTVGTVVGVAVGVLAVGVGLGIASVAATTIGTDVAEEISGSATGVLNTGAQLGTALGVAALVTVAAGVGGRAGTSLGWGLAAAGAAATALVLLLRRSDRSL